MPEIPIKPKRPLLYAIGVGASLALAFLFGFLREARQNVILGEWELPDDCVVLARLPYIEIPVPTSVRQSRRRTNVPAKAAGRQPFRRATLAGRFDCGGSLFLTRVLIMYKPFFGLRKSPFNMTPDPEFLYLTQQHREALAGLTYAVLARKGFVVLTGDAGTGKTTLVTRVLQHLPPSSVQTSVISNPTLTPAEFLEATLLDFGFTDVPDSKAQRIARLQNFLLQGHREGKVSALIVDEAHKLTPELLEEIRLLGNFESADEKLLQVALVGQGELDELLDRDQLRQFKQRIAVRLSMSPISGTDIAQYCGSAG